MRAQIGYSANDSATQLSRSHAGIQFLGLAAVLTSSVGAFEGANALSVMLLDSASDKTLLPTARQLKDLLNVMEHRLNRSGFADMLVGYEILLSGCGYISSLMEIPRSDGISNLVKAFGQLNRLGDATAITLRTAYCVPWIMAFTRWCLGIPPSIISVEGKALLDQPASRIILFIDRGVGLHALEISVQRSIDSPADLLKLQTFTSDLPSMITVECFGQKMCHDTGGKGSTKNGAMCEALPYALKQSCELLRLGKSSWIDKNAIECRSNAFPEDSKISSVLTRVLNWESPQHLKRLERCQMISDLPLTREHLHKLPKSCSCDSCRRRVMKPHRTSDNFSTCDRIKDELLRDIALYTACILALSLFESPETLLVSVPRFGTRQQFPVALHSIIKSGEPSSCTIEEIHDWARTFVGHKNPGNGESWVLSSYKGQAVYPKVYETGDLCQTGYLALCWAPGVLFFDGEVYDRCMEPSRLPSKVYAADSSSLQPTPVPELLKLLPKMKMEWKVVHRDGYLEVYPARGNHFGRASNILSNLSHALILRECPHNSALPLDKPNPYLSYRSPTQARRRPITGGQFIDVVLVDGDAGLRMFTLTCSWDSSLEEAFVIGDNACLQCCLDLCRRTGYRSVIW